MTESSGSGDRETQRLVWSELAREVGLTLDMPRGSTPKLRGTSRRFEIRVLPMSGNITLQVHDVYSWFSLGRRRGGERLNPVAIETGDPEFDDTIAVSGSPEFALGLLQFEARQAAQIVVRDLGGTLRDHQIRVVVQDLDRVSTALGKMLDLAELVGRASADELPARLARNSLEDPSPGFRVRVFQELLEVPRAATEVLPTARALLESEYAELRLEAARYLSTADPEYGVSAATALADIVQQQDLESTLREKALEALALSGYPEQAFRLALALLEGAEDEPAALRCSALARLVQAGAVDELLACPPSGDPLVAEAQARALGQCGDRRAQPRLLTLLDHPSSDVKIAAAEALGSVGGGRAVPSLRKVGEYRSSGISPLAQAAEQAVILIQERLGRIQHGEVSIVSLEPLEGAVSRADGSPTEGDSQGGEVSLVDPAPLEGAVSPAEYDEDEPAGGEASLA